MPMHTLYYRIEQGKIVERCSPADLCREIANGFEDALSARLVTRAKVGAPSSERMWPKGPTQAELEAALRGVGPKPMPITLENAAAFAYARWLALRALIQ